MTEELRQRADRHGLRRQEGPDGRAAWMFEHGPPFVHHHADGSWRWGDGGAHDLPYVTEEVALAGALGWLDEQDPDKAYRQSPGAKLGEAVALLRGLEAKGKLSSRPHGVIREELYKGIAEAVALLQSLVLPPASDEGAVLEVALDFALTKGPLTGSAREALVRAAHDDPRMVVDAKVAGPLMRDESATAMMVLRCYTLHGLAGEVGHDEDHDRWWWKLGRAVGFMVLQWVSTKELATSRLAAALLEHGYALCPASSPAPHATCPNCGVSLGLDPGGRCAECGAGLPEWGALEPAATIPCPECRGTGSFVDNNPRSLTYATSCHHCAGTGRGP